MGSSWLGISWSVRIHVDVDHHKGALTAERLT